MVPFPKSGHIYKTIFFSCKLGCNSQAAYKTLCDNNTLIIEANLDVHLLADKLLSISVITDADWRHVIDRLTGQSSAERMRFLLGIVRATVKGNGPVFCQFIEILKKGDSIREKDLAEKLLTSYKGI